MLPIQISKRARLTPPSPIRRLVHLSRAAHERGIEVFHLNIGQPDIPTPLEFFEGLRQYKDAIVSYEASEGNALLRRTWADYMNRTIGLSVRPDQFLITTGASEALIFTFMITCDPGDEVLIFDPTYANYIGFAAISGVDLVSLITKIEDEFTLPSSQEIEAKMTSRTRAILLCSPNNPTGNVYNRQELQALIDLCNKHNVFLVVDETYREFVYDGREALSVLHLEPENERLIVIDSLSKRFSLCGARVGALITPNRRVLEKGLSLAQARLSVSSIEQFAAAHMLQQMTTDYVQSIRDEYQSRRDVLAEELGKIPGVITYKPAGAFYTVARLPVPDADDFARFMLSEFSHEGKTVFVAPASGFYMSNERGGNKIRIACVLKKEDLRVAVRLLAIGLKAYQSARSGEY